MTLHTAEHRSRAALLDSQRRVLERIANGMQGYLFSKPVPVETLIPLLM